MSSWLSFFLSIGLMASCSPSSQKGPTKAPQRQERSLIGLTVADAIRQLRLQLDEDFVINEPPGVPRGVYGETPSGDEIELYIRRGAVPFSEQINWPLQDFEDKRVLGVARRVGGKWQVEGEVMLIRSMRAQ